MITSQFSSVQSLSPVRLFGWHHLLNGSVDMSFEQLWAQTGKSSVLQSMGLQRLGQEWETEQQQGVK